MIDLLFLLSLLGIVFVYLGAFLLIPGFCMATDTDLKTRHFGNWTIVIGLVLVLIGKGVVVRFEHVYYSGKDVTRLAQGWEFGSCYIPDEKTPGGDVDQKMYVFYTIGASGFKRPVVVWKPEAFPPAPELRICDIVDQNGKTLVIRDDKHIRVIKEVGEKLQKVVVPRDNWMSFPRWTMPASRAWVYEKGEPASTGRLIEWVAN